MMLSVEPLLACFRNATVLSMWATAMQYSSRFRSKPLHQKQGGEVERNSFNVSNRTGSGAARLLAFLGLH